MNKPSEFEIPESVRDMAEQNVTRAREAYDQFMGLARKAQEQVVKSQGAMAASALDIQSKALGFAEKNIQSSFDYASRMVRARDLKEYMELQTEYAQSQLEAFNRQAQDIGKLLTDLAQKSTKNT